MEREELKRLFIQMDAAFKSEAFRDRMWAAVEAKQTMMMAPQILEITEQLQVEELNQWGHQGVNVLEEMKRSAKLYPDPDFRAVVLAMCETEEKLIDDMHRKLAEKFGLPMPPPEVSRQAAHQMAQRANPQLQLAMQMAVQSLTPDQRATMQRLQMKMMSGQPPEGDDLQKMAEVQSAIQAYVSMMSAVIPGLTPPAGGGATPHS